ncbi:MAG: DUF1553 domain-containing protein [Bacteroidetes bacterium]|nr:DUF1553 domain-containing protein [Bacteroidota bacterium]
MSLALLVVSGGIYWWIAESSRPVDFNTQVKPILNKRCITCHGGVKRESEYSLLFRKEAMDKGKSGKLAIIAGDAAHSELIKRINASDPEERMPYKKDPLTKEEIEILTKWIDQGAPWGDHWAYTKVESPEVPAASSWTKNSIDQFILEKMDEHDLSPSPQASNEMLLRRVSLDLTGLPADEKVQKDFLQGKLSYENLVDSLLNSPHYGERWASVWLDLARYADTKGYERDDSRTIWRYRDWVINAFNRDMPYDSFLIEQLAGDLLPNPTDNQYLATAFHRNSMTNDEGGTDNEEFRTAAVLDRVNTTWEGLMGTTFACVQCHSHPYDPFRQEEYYKFMAFFNNTRDEDTEADYPLLRHLEKGDEEKLKEITDWVKKNTSEEKAREVYTFVKTGQPAINSLLSDRFVNAELSDTKWLVFRNHGVARLAHVDVTNKNFLIYRFASFKPGGTWTIHLDKPDGPVIKQLVLPETKSWVTEEVSITPFAGTHDLYFTYVNPNLKKAEDSGVLFDWFYFTDYSVKRVTENNIGKNYWELVTKNFPTTPIMMENPPSMKRTTQVFRRGNWLVKTDTVQADVPASLNPIPASMPHNRLGLAQWMVSEDNPLVSRTIVNRVWEQLFGIGLVETLEDMGTQGMPPTHPELLNYLSYHLMHDDQWSLKKLVREIVLSATYRQDSKVTEAHLTKDPLNKFYARAPRVRLSAEQVRDQALAVSGLLSNKMFGPSVMPYQPGGIWLSPWNGATWKISKGEDRHRRALYTYWKRTAPYPSMMTFDGSAREVCTARRIRTNTPLQALVMLNDSVYVEASYQLAALMQKSAKTLEEQIKFGYTRAIGHAPSSEVVKALAQLYTRTAETMEVKRVNNSKPAKNNRKENAMMLVASAILNLDEFVTKN